MSHDAHGFPIRRRAEFGVDPVFALGARTIGAHPLMDLYGCWARGDAVTSVTTASYLNFDVPQLQPGTVILVTGSATLTSDGANTGDLRLAVVPDPITGTPSPTVANTGPGGAASLSGIFNFLVVIPNGSAGGISLTSFAAILAGTTIKGNSVSTTITARMYSRWALQAVTLGGGTTTINHAVIEVYIPRAYR